MAKKTKVKPGQSSLTKHALGMVSILILQYLLGMATTLFVQFPASEKDQQLWAFAWRQPSLALHIILGLLLLIGTIALFIRALRLHSRVWKISSGISIAAVLGAVLAGALFIPSQTDLYSFIMALAFIIALLSYGWGLYSTKD